MGTPSGSGLNKICVESNRYAIKQYYGNYMQGLVWPVTKYVSGMEAATMKDYWNQKDFHNAHLVLLMYFQGTIFSSC